MAVVRGCEVIQVPHQEKRFCFVLKHKQRQPLYLSAEKEKLMFSKRNNISNHFIILFLYFIVSLVWMDALTKAATGILPGPKTIDWNEYYDILNIPYNEELTLNSLNKAYRKAALKTHPDKGGDVDRVSIISL